MECKTKSEAGSFEKKQSKEPTELFPGGRGYETQCSGGGLALIPRSYFRRNKFQDYADEAASLNSGGKPVSTLLK